MENKARKMFAAVVVIMLCAVAIVGVGYAYTASTQNDGNNASSNYVMLSQDKYSWGTKDIYYDTLTKKVDTNVYFYYTFLSAYNGAKAGAIPNTGDAVYGVAMEQASLLKATHTGTVAAAPYALTMSAPEDFTSPNNAVELVITFDKGVDGSDRYQWAEYKYVTSAYTWVYHGHNGTSAQNDGIYLADNVSYTTQLYVGTVKTDDATTTTVSDWVAQFYNVVAADGTIVVDANAPTDILDDGSFKMSIALSTISS